MTINQINTEIERQINCANGRRRARTIDARQVWQAIREALAWTQYGFVSGGKVAGSYKYASTTTTAYAVQFAPGHVALEIGAIDAHKNSSETTWATGCRSNDLTGQRAKFGPRTDGTPPAIYLTIRQARAYLQRLDAARAAEHLGMAPDALKAISLTVADSLAAGNCRTQTNRVQAIAGGAKSMLLADILTLLQRHNLTHLTPYAIRAARHVARKAHAAA